MWGAVGAVVVTLLVMCLQDGYSQSTTTPPPSVYCPPYPSSPDYTMDNTDTVAGTVIAATCVVEDQFYSFGLSTLQITCDEDGIWSPNVTDHCSLYFPPCTQIPLPNNTVRTTEAVASGTTALYTCSEVNMLFDVEVVSVSIQCSTSGEWLGDLPTSCIYMECEPVPAVNFAYASTAFTFFGTNVAYSCAPGYSFDGASQTVWSVRCGGTEAPFEWETVSPANQILPSECVPIVCPNVTVPEYTLGLDNTALTVWTSFNLWCWDGFTYNGKRIQTGTCQTTGSFDTVYPCSQVQCSALVVNNATTDISTRFYGDTVTYTCNYDLLFPGGSKTWTTYCNHQGYWDPIPPTSGCTLGKCSDSFVNLNDTCFFISNPLNGERLRAEGAQERCTYLKANLAHVASEAERTFLKIHSYDVTEIYSYDYWLGGYRDTDTLEWKWRGGVENLTFDGWLPGYPDPDYDQINKSLCIRLTFEGYWKERDCYLVHPYICRKGQVCSVLPTIAHGVIAEETINSFYEVGESTTYTCDPGYHFVTSRKRNMTTYCQEGGFWDWIESCQLIVCPPLRRVPNAIPSTTVTTLGTQVTYSCKSGYEFWDGTTSSKTIECIGAGEWNGIVRYCKEIVCPLPGIQFANHTYGRNKVGETDVYVCMDGFYFEGFLPLKYNLSITCEAGGTWGFYDMPISACKPLSCPEITHEDAEVSPQFQVVSQSVTVTCNNGYTFADNSTKVMMTCMADKTYDPPVPPDCLPLMCPPLPAVPHAQPRPAIRTIGAVVWYVCDPGFSYPDGQNALSVTCDIDTREWSSPPAGCIDQNAIRQEIDWAPEHSEGWVVGCGVAMTIILSILILAPIIADATTLNGDFKKLVEALDVQEEEERRRRMDEMADSDSEDGLYNGRTSPSAEGAVGGIE